MRDGLRFYLKTMGCQMNEHDSEVITGLLESMGYEETTEVERADLIMYNTCSVRENPERKVYGHMGSFKALKEKNPQLIIGICGCMAQQPLERESIVKKLPHVDLVFGTHNIHRLPELLTRVLDGERVVEVFEEGNALYDDLPVKRKGTLKAFVNIIYGCTNFCSYCIVPYTRGKERSRLPEDILREIQALTEKGYKEVTLLGQNVNAYGKDLAKEYSFARLLKEVDANPNLERIRFTTSHPRDVTEELLVSLRTLPRVCEHLHLPVQSGSNEILRAMNRGYSREYYLALVARLKESVPGIRLTTDLIVGFPGETEEDFLRTLELVREVEFSSAFTFLYSKRKGTPAYGMELAVPEEVKKERIYRLIALQNAISAKKNQERVGETLEVLVDEVFLEKGLVSGRTRTNELLQFEGKKELLGKVVDVKVTKAQTFSLQGVL